MLIWNIFIIILTIFINLLGNFKYTPKDHSRQWIQTYSKFEIPIPPLEMQEQIVNALDKFSKLEFELKDELETEIDCRKKQYEYYRNKLLSFEVDNYDKSNWT